MVRMSKLFLLLLVALMMATGLAFTPPGRPKRCHECTRTLRMSSVEVHNENESCAIGETERILLQAVANRELGLKQELGQTIKKDGLDGVRALVWTVFDVSQIVFGCLTVALSLGLLLNMMGYGYYFEWDQGGFAIDTLEHIRQDRVMAAEAAKLASGAAQKLSSSYF